MPKTVVPRIIVQPPSPTEKSALNSIKELHCPYSANTKSRKGMYVNIAILKEQHIKTSRFGNSHCHLYPTDKSLPLDDAANMIFDDNGGKFIFDDLCDYYRDVMGHTDRRLFFAIMVGDETGFEVKPNTTRVIVQDKYLQYNISGLNKLVLREMGVPISLPDVRGRRRQPFMQNSLEAKEVGFATGDIPADSSRRSSPELSMVAGGMESPTSQPITDLPVIDLYLGAHGPLLLRARSSGCLPSGQIFSSSNNYLNPRAYPKKPKKRMRETSI